jgi:hypothetical protein
MSPTRIITVIAVAGALGVAAACGGSTGGPEPERAATLDTTPATATSATPARTPTPTATRTPKPRPTPTSSSGGNGDADESAAPSTAGGGVCSHLGAERVGAVVGAAVRGTAVSGETGCTFAQGGKRGTSVTVLDRSTAQVGGMAGAKDEATSTVEGEPQDVAGIGAAAFVVTGSMFGEPDVQGAGAVQVGTRIVSVFLEQHHGMGAAKVRALETELLRLVARQAS